MKYIKYLIIALTGIFAAACAGDEPTSVGTIEPKITVSQITATTASITVDLSECISLFADMEDGISSGRCTVVLSTDYYGDYSESFELGYYNTDSFGLNLIGTVEFYNLTPNTTYRYCIDIPTSIGDVSYRNDEYTFTTTPEGDYSSLDGIKPYEVLLGDKFAVIN